MEIKHPLVFHSATVYFSGRVPSHSRYNLRPKLTLVPYFIAPREQVTTLGNRLDSGPVRKK